MIITGPEITRAAATGQITLAPFDVASVNPNSYNYHLGPELIIFPKGRIDPTDSGARIRIPDHGFVMKPGHLYLGSTAERIGSKKHATTLIGRSTIGRLGLWLQVTADLGHVGTSHRWTLEMKVVQPLRVFAGMPIGQVSFWECSGELPEYDGRYAHDDKPMTSKLSQ